MDRILTAGLRACLIGVSAAIAGGAATSTASADCLLRIIHTNDLHSHLEHSNDPDLGGYAGVKAAIDALKADARSRNIPTLTLDAGDFLEGSEYYLAGHGEKVFQIMNEMGYDAVAIGNHDWLMGLNRLDQIVGQVRPSFAFLGANFIFDWAQSNLTRYMHQWAEFRRGGARIAVLGLTTDEYYYAWRVDSGILGDPLAEAREDIPELRSRNDFVIALTHLGVRKDKNLVRNVRGIDLVVGGHSHTRLDAPESAPDPDGKTVPIVQAGQFGEFVGDLLVDACPGRPLRVVSYDLVPVRVAGPKDAAIEHEVEDTDRELERQYGADWWNEVVGRSDVPLRTSWGGTTEWGDLVADALRSAGQAEIALDLNAFTGLEQPAGEIRRKQIVALYPHIFELDSAYGWTVWTGSIPGLALRFALNFFHKHSFPFSLSGITLDVVPDPVDGGTTRLDNIRINGEPLSLTRSYKIALPEGVVRGALNTSGFFSLLFHDAQDTRVPIWTAIERQLRSEGALHAYASPERTRIRVLSN